MARFGKVAIMRRLMTMRSLETYLELFKIDSQMIGVL
jgi:hypothetical protein